LVGVDNGCTCRCSYLAGGVVSTAPSSFGLPGENLVSPSWADGRQRRSRRPLLGCGVLLDVFVRPSSVLVCQLAGDEWVSMVLLLAHKASVLVSLGVVVVDVVVLFVSALLFLALSTLGSSQLCFVVTISPLLMKNVLCTS
jgi:hypothetical protein